MAARPLPDREYINQALDYDHHTGEFRWKERPLEHFVNARGQWQWNAKWAGRFAGCLNRDGYSLIRLRSSMVMAHRLAWLLTYGEPVPSEIDHRDGNRSNNRIDNIRAATRADNLANNRTRRDSTTGVKGVYPMRGKFQAYIRRHKQRYYLGIFDTLEEASAARREAAERLHGEFARHS